MPPRKYHLLWVAKAVPEGITGAEIDKLNEDRPADEKWSACDAITLLSMAYPASGGYSQLLIPIDGRPEAKASAHELSDHEVFKAWALLAHRLMQSKTLGDGQKGLAEMVHETIRSALMRSRAEEMLTEEPS